MNILAPLQKLSQVLTKTEIKRMGHVVTGMLRATGKITMLNISRWTDKGGSYRTIQRFYGGKYDWLKMCWQLFKANLYEEKEVYILAGDECLTPKAGKKTHGLDRLFSGVIQQSMSCFATFTLSLVGTKERESYPINTKQVVRSPEEKAAAKAKAVARKAKKKKKTKGKPGRPKGSKNKDKTQVELTPELERIQDMIRETQMTIGELIDLDYVALDGHFGNNNALQMVRQCNLHLISKLRHDAKLHYPAQTSGNKQKYGDRIDPYHIPQQYLRHTQIEKGVRTDTYQIHALHAKFAQKLNVVIIVKTNLKTGKQAHVILFSSDLTLAWDKLVDYYTLRFQIEFNFRDAKQYWGLDDFMNIKETQVTNAINLSFFMVNFAKLLLKQQPDSNVKVLDLKAQFRGLKYVSETIKLLPQKPDPILLAYIYKSISQLGAIHTCAS